MTWLWFDIMQPKMIYNIYEKPYVNRVTIVSVLTRSKIMDPLHILWKRSNVATVKEIMEFEVSHIKYC